MRSLEQEIAESAYRHVHEIRNENNSALEQAYGSLCHRFPQRVMLNGLRLTLIFMQAKAKTRGDDSVQGKNNANAYFHRHLMELLKPDDFTSAGSYRYQTRLALRAALWYKRYAEAILGVTEAKEAEE